MRTNLGMAGVISGGKKRKGILLCFFKSFGSLLVLPVLADGFAASPLCMQKRRAWSQTNWHAALWLV